MFGLLKNELIKLHLRKKFIISVLVLIAISSLVSLGLAATYKLVKPEKMVETQQNAIANMKLQREKATTDKEKSEFDAQITQMEQQMDVFKNMPVEDDPNWKENLTAKIERLELEADTASELTGEKENKRMEIITSKYLLEHNIKPKNDMNPTGFNMLLVLASLLGPIFLVIIVAIITSDIVSSEYTPPTMKVLLTRPVSRAKVLLSKYAASIVSSVIIILAVELLIAFIMGLIFGFGDLSYPVVIGAKYKSTILNAFTGKEMVPIYNTAVIISMGSFLLRTLLYQILFIITVASFFILLSTVLKSSALSMSLSIVVTIALNILGNIGYFKFIKPFLFTTFGDVPSLLSGSTIKAANSSLASPLSSVLILLAWSIISYGIAHLNFTRKDILV